MSPDPQNPLLVAKTLGFSEEVLSGTAEPGLLLAGQELASQMPYVLLSLLERRYLSPLKPEHWRFELPSKDAHRPLLREVTRLGKPEPGEWAKVMPHLLTSCLEPGHALIMALHGNVGRNRIYLGCRRLGGGRSTKDYLAAQESALRSSFVGLKLGGEAMRLDATGLPEMAWLAQAAPAMAAMTGIASGRTEDGLPAVSQSFDRLIEAAGNHNYLLMVVAEPIDPQEVDATVDRLRQLKSEIHSYARRTINRSRSLTEGTSRTEVAQESVTSLLPLIFFGLAGFLDVAGGLGKVLTAGAQAAAQGITSLGWGMNTWAGREQARRNRQLSSGTTDTDSATTELLDANAEFCEQLLDEHIGRLAHSTGLWQTSIYIASDSEAGVQSIGAALKGTCSGRFSGLDPLRLHVLPTHVLQPALESGRVLRMVPAAGESAVSRHPLGPSFDSLATCLNSTELSLLVNMPAKEIAGLPMRDHATFALSVPVSDTQEIPFGHLLDPAGRTIETVAVNRATLNRHVFVTGMTGYGKSNTCMALLVEAYRRYKVPFLVIEPAKAEYQKLRGITELRDKVQVFVVGGESRAPFRLNPLNHVEGIPLGRHIDLLKAVFNASFPMGPGMAPVLEDAIYEIYGERGWSHYTSDNRHLANAGAHGRSALVPDLQDLHDQIDVVLKKKNYAGEVHQNMGAALRSRLHSLMVGNKGLMLNTRRSIPLRDLFFKPTIIELQNMGDDEEKAFVMALLFVFLYEFAEIRQNLVGPNQKGTLQHITLIEEAHRLLKAPSRVSSPETGDPQGKAVTMFTDMLAEMRAYGEGFIIADQSPTKLVSDTLKNTNLKIIHRLSHPDDRSAAGGCVNLTPRQTLHLNNLPPGQAVVHDERIGEAVLVQVHQFKDVDCEAEDLAAVAPGVTSPVSDPSYLYRHSGCRSCPDPCAYLHLVHDFQLVDNQRDSFDAFIECILFEDFEGTLKKWAPLRKTISLELTNGRDDDGPLFCAVLTRLERWLEDVIRAGSTHGQLSAQARLLREAALEKVGKLLSGWMDKDNPTGDYVADLRSAHEGLSACITLAAPDGSKRACPGCGGQCVAFPFISSQLKDPRQAFSGCVQGAHRTETEELLRRLYAEHARPKIPLLSRHENNSMIKTTVMRCLVANLPLPPLPLAAHEKKAELIAALQGSGLGNANET